MIRFYLILFLLTVAAVQSEEASVKQKRVYVDICGDLLHVGHIEIFKKAREFGDYLIVGVLSDADIASYKRVPILTLEERVAEIQGCRYVDEVIAGAPPTITEELIREKQIDVVIHGDDYDLETLRQWYGVPMSMGIFRTVPYTKGISTTDIIKRVVERYK